MFLFQFVKHGQPPTAPQPGAAHTSGLENWGWIFLSFRTRDLVESQRDMDSVMKKIILRTHRDRNHRNSIC